MADSITSEYSLMLENDMWVAVGNDYDKEYDFNELLGKINRTDFFRPFSERLLTFYNEILRSSYTAYEAISDLQRRTKQKNIPLSRNSIANWFSGKTVPKYGDNDRRNMFALAFALELDCEKTERLFHKVFLDKAFNKRNAHEFIFLYCICNRKSLSEADNLISQLNSTNEIVLAGDRTERTQFLTDAARRDVGERELLNFMSSHQHNFSLNNTAAKKHRQVLLDKLAGNADRAGLARQEYEHRRAELADEKDALGFEKRDPTSVDFLMYIITDADFVRKGYNEILSIRDKFPRKEISNQFPNKQTLSQKEPSSYVLRKDIILLYFYSYWVTDYLKDQNIGDYDGFVAELNDIMFDCGFSPLYIGNPYDWLILYCSACSGEDCNPLDIFRGILARD